MTGGLPQGWRRTTIGELGRYLNGRGFKKSEWRETGRPIIRIQNLTGSGAAFNYYQGEVEDRYVARPGDLLVSWAATLGAYFWNGPEAVVNQHIFKVESNIDRRFHKYLLDHKLADLMRHTHGSGMVHITRGRFDAEPVHVPVNTDEQRRIVEILEDHLSHLDAAGASLARVAALSRSIAAASASNAVSAALSDGAPVRKLGDLAVRVEYGSSARANSDSAAGDIPVLRMGNVKYGEIDWENLKYMPSDHADLPKLLLSDGDLLFNRTNSAEHVGKCAVFKGSTPTTFASYLIRVRFGPDVLPDWANLVMNSPFGRHYVASVVSQQVGQANVNGTKLRAFPLVLPSISDQRAHLAQHERVIEGASRVRQTMAHAELRERVLRRAVLTAAFEGRLTGRHTDAEMIEETAERMDGSR